MTYKLQLKDGARVQFNATAKYTRVFHYSLESGSEDYFDVSFFLTDLNDVIMTVGRTREYDEFFKKPGTYSVPFATVIKEKDLSRLAYRNILGVKIDVSPEVYVRRLCDFLDNKISKDFWITPFGSPKAQTVLHKMIPLLDMLAESNAGSAVKEKLIQSSNFLKNKVSFDYSGYAKEM